MDVSNLIYKDGNLLRRDKRGNIVPCNAVNSQGYKQLRVGDKCYLQHRVVWFMHHGYWPEVIDHIDKNKLNNRIENLRECTQRQNSLNQSGSRRSTSKYKGVSWDKVNKKWLAQIMVHRRGKKLGRFVDELDAARAYNNAALQYFGEFAQLNEV